MKFFKALDSTIRLILGMIIFTCGLGVVVGGITLIVIGGLGIMKQPILLIVTWGETPLNSLFFIRDTVAMLIGVGAIYLGRFFVDEGLNAAGSPNFPRNKE